MEKNCYKNDPWLDSLIEEDKDSFWLEFSSQIARRVLYAIKEMPNLNQTKLASKLGCSPQQVSKILKGKENLTLSTIAKLTQVLGVELIKFPDYGWSVNPIRPHKVIVIGRHKSQFQFDRINSSLEENQVIEHFSTPFVFKEGRNQQNVWQSLVKEASFEVE